jgi:hypothetical protein
LQIKSTVLLMPSGSDRITSAPLQPLQSDKALEDEDIKALLATRCAFCSSSCRRRRQQQQQQKSWRAAGQLAACSCLRSAVASTASALPALPACPCAADSR